MSSVLKKEFADKYVFKHQAKPITIETTKVAKDFVNLQNSSDSGFQIAEVVAEQAGVEALRKQNIEAQVEETVLARLKDIEEQAYKKAFELGMIEGADKAFNEKRAEFELHLQRLDQIFLLLDNLKLEMVKMNEEEMMKFLHILASRIAMREITLDKQPLLEMITQVTADVQSAETVNVRLNPSDLQFIEDLRAKDIKTAEKMNRMKFHADTTISPGGCIAETNYGSIDGTIEQRIEKAWTLLEAKLPVLNKVK